MLPTTPSYTALLSKFIDRFVSLRADERHFAAAAALWAPAVELSLATLGVRRTIDWVERATPTAPRASRPPLACPQAKYLVDLAYRLSPLQGTCLPRSVLQYGLQRRRSADVRFVIGVRRPSDAETESTATAGLAAHAWVEGNSHVTEPGARTTEATHTDTAAEVANAVPFTTLWSRTGLTKPASPGHLA